MFIFCIGLVVVVWVFVSVVMLFIVWCSSVWCVVGVGLFGWLGGYGEVKVDVGVG